LVSNLKQTYWSKVFVKVVVVFLILLISDFLVANLFGSQIRSVASYFFGDNPRITLSILLFIEGGLFLALGSLWSLGSSENVSYGLYRKNYSSFNKEDWKNRTDQARNPNDVIKIFLIVGALTLITATVIVLI
jgi:hypothetical protein